MNQNGNNTNGMKGASKNGWRAKNRFILQAVALALGVLAPFALYFAMQSGLALLAGVAFILIVLAMGLTFWAG